MRRLVEAASILAGIGFWQITAEAGWVDPRYLPPPSTVVPALWRILADGSLQPHIVATLERMFAGFAVAVPIGLALGILCALWRPALWALGPLIEVVRAIPPLALLPAFLLFFGIGFKLPFMMTIYVTWVPVFLNTIAGIRGVPREYVEAASLDTGPARIGWTIQLPLAAPTIVTGVRLAMGASFLVVPAAEFLGSTKGLGFYIFNASQTFHGPEMYAAILVLGALAFVSNLVLEDLGRRLEPEREPSKSTKRTFRRSGTAQPVRKAVPDRVTRIPAGLRGINVVNEQPVAGAPEPRGLPPSA